MFALAFSPHWQMCKYPSQAAKKTAQLSLLERTGSPCISCTETTTLVLKDIAIEGRLYISTTAQAFTAEHLALSYEF